MTRNTIEPINFRRSCAEAWPTSGVVSVQRVDVCRLARLACSIHGLRILAGGTLERGSFAGAYLLSRQPVPGIGDRQLRNFRSGWASAASWQHSHAFSARRDARSIVFGQRSCHDQNRHQIMLVATLPPIVARRESTRARIETVDHLDERHPRPL